MIGMVMGNDDPIDIGRTRCQQLFAKIRTAVDQQRLTTALNQDRRARAPITRFSGIAVTPVVADPRNPG